jgi:23S rRNA (adenine-N6)-dimethyltransferase
VPARRRSHRDQRRRALGQNFISPAAADQFVEQAHFQAGELVVEIGAGLGTITAALAERDVRVVALELDPTWAAELRKKFGKTPDVRILARDFFQFNLPTEPFRFTGSLPFGRTTDILRRLLDDPNVALERADVIVQWEVAKKRAAIPPATLLSSAWAPWWEIDLKQRISARQFRPVPRTDAGILSIAKREPPLLPPAMANAYAQFVRQKWPFETSDKK